MERKGSALHHHHNEGLPFNRLMFAPFMRVPQTCILSECYICFAVEVLEETTAFNLTVYFQLICFPVHDIWYSYTTQKTLLQYFEFNKVDLIGL